MNKVLCSANKFVANSFPPSSLTTVDNCNKFGDSHPPKWLAKNSGSRGVIQKRYDKLNALCGSDTVTCNSHEVCCAKRFPRLVTKGC